MRQSAGENYVRFAAELDQPDAVEPIEQPAPKPLVATRPLKLSVTAIDRLRDPHTIYAKYILARSGSTPWTCRCRRPTGSAIHGALGGHAKIRDALPPQPALVLRGIGENTSHR
jgi:ATP-dependent helicase/nuclease subunit B